MNIREIAIIIFLPLYILSANESNDGMKDLCEYFSIFSLNLMISAGISIITVARLITMPLASTNPRSLPTLNFIIAIARNPTIVVIELATIAPADSRSAISSASWISMPFCLYAVKV